jgi:hypothetical protein
MKKFIMDIVTEPNNHTICPVRIAAIAGILQYQGMALLHYFQHHIFDAQPYALGSAAILGSAGLALGLKHDSPKE